MVYKTIFSALKWGQENSNTDFRNLKDYFWGSFWKILPKFRETFLSSEIKKATLFLNVGFFKIIENLPWERYARFSRELSLNLLVDVFRIFYWFFSYMTIFVVCVLFWRHFRTYIYVYILSFDKFSWDCIAVSEQTSLRTFLYASSSMVDLPWRFLFILSLQLPFRWLRPVIYCISTRNDSSRTWLVITVTKQYTRGCDCAHISS